TGHTMEARRPDRARLAATRRGSTCRGRHGDVMPLLIPLERLPDCFDCSDIKVTLQQLRPPLAALTANEYGDIANRLCTAVDLRRATTPNHQRGYDVHLNSS